MSDLVTSLALAFVIIGILLLIAEVVSPGTFLVIPGTVLLILGAIGMVFPGLLLSWWSPLIAGLVMIPTTILTIKFYQKLGEPIPPTTTVSGSLIGRTGTVEVRVTPGNLRGKVRIDSETWSATSQNEIDQGTEVIVVGSEGVHIKVEPLKKEED